MARRFEERVEAVRQAAETPQSADSRKDLQRVLRGKQGYLISVAARALSSGGEDLRPLAIEAFDRLLEDPISRDPQCHGKLAIAQVLYDQDHTGHDPFEAGVQHVQLEPVLGGRQDTAASLRGLCLMALMVQLHPRAWVFAGAMLADPERAARLAAVRAIDSGGRPDLAEPLLRLAFQVEADPEVAMDCLAGLLRLDPHANLPLAQARLRGSDAEQADVASLALGAARPEGALALLARALEDTFEEGRRRTCATAIAMLRTDAAWQQLIELILEGELRLAQASVEALGSFQDHPGLRERVADAVADRGDPDLDASLDRVFGSS